MASLPRFPLLAERSDVMDTRVSEMSGMAEEFSKFAHEMAVQLRERAGELEASMTKVMDEAGKEFVAKFGDENKLGSYFESNPRKAAFVALMTGMMFTRMIKTRGVSPFFGTGPEMKSGETSRRKMNMSAKAKAA